MSMVYYFYISQKPVITSDSLKHLNTQNRKTDYLSPYHFLWGINRTKLKLYLFNFFATQAPLAVLLFRIKTRTYQRSRLSSRQTEMGNRLPYKWKRWKYVSKFFLYRGCAYANRFTLMIETIKGTVEILIMLGFFPCFCCF